MTSQKYGLQQVFYNKIIDEVLDQRGDNQAFRVLILDEFSTKLIASCCKSSELIEKNIAVIENLSKKRKPLPNLDAIYLVKPDKNSINLIIDDFEINKKSPMEEMKIEEPVPAEKVKYSNCFCCAKISNWYNNYVYGAPEENEKSPNSNEPNRLYKSAYVFFAGLCSTYLMDQLRLSVAGKYIKDCIEISINYFPIERQVFSFLTPETLSFYYQKTVNEKKKAHLEYIAEQLASVCASLNEYPIIRYRDENNLREDFAMLVKQKLDKFKEKNPSLGEGENKNKSQLLILDRSFDIVSPLVHEFTYQAMVYDLVAKIQKDGVYNFKNEAGDPRSGVLDENDPVWVDLRHKHVADTSKFLSEQFQKFKAVNSQATKEDLSISELAKLVKKMPQLTKEIEKYSLHLSLTDECMYEYNEKRIKMSEFEQNIAMGYDLNGEKVKDFTFEMVQLLIDDDFEKNDKLRLIMLYLLNKNGILQKNIITYLTHAEIHDKKKENAILNLAKLGFDIIKPESGQAARLNIDRSEKKERAYKYDSSRWTPLVKDLMENILDGTLNKTKYPYLSEKDAQAFVSSQTNQGVSARAGGLERQQPNNKQSQPRLFVFIVGGVTYSEMRCAYEVQEANKKCQVYIGSNEVIDPDDFIDNLSNMN